MRYSAVLNSLAKSLKAEQHLELHSLVLSTQLCSVDIGVQNCFYKRVNKIVADESKMSKRQQNWCT